MVPTCIAPHAKGILSRVTHPKKQRLQSSINPNRGAKLIIIFKHLNLSGLLFSGQRITMHTRDDSVPPFIFRTQSANTHEKAELFVLGFLNRFESHPNGFLFLEKLQMARSIKIRPIVCNCVFFY